MKKKAVLLTAIGVLSLGTISAAIFNQTLAGSIFTLANTPNNYWNHYEAVEPTYFRHGSKEFWASCSTLTYTLEEPVGVTIREGDPFETTQYFDELDKNDPRYIPHLKIDIKAHLTNLLNALTHDPYSYIPDSMRPDGVDRHTASSLEYDFTNFVNVSNITYGGFGEQWHMIVENIKESERFYNITTYGSQILGAANAVVMSFLDENEDNVVTWSYSGDERYRSKLEFDNGVLDYSIKFITGVNIPLFGTVTPQIDMNYVVDTGTKTVRIQLGENNALKFVITPDSYTFGLEYGVEQVSRKAYFSIEKDDEDNVEGHIYEYVQYKDKDLMPSCADFYIDEDYTSVVGNKASGITGFTGYINELYESDEGKLLGYKVKETFFKWGIEKTYNTLWFNLNNITGINSVKAISNGGVDPHENNHDIYLNGSSSVFEPDKNKVAFVKTSRKYDVEMRKQYFYDLVSSEIAEYETSIPMMFIQDDGTESGETNYSTFEQDIHDKNGINASVNLANAYLTKIRADYLTLIDIFDAHKGDVTTDSIVNYIGDAQNI